MHSFQIVYCNESKNRLKENLNSRTVYCNGNVILELLRIDE